jgi:hypothetical protein
VRCDEDVLADVVMTWLDRSSSFLCRASLAGSFWYSSMRTLALPPYRDTVSKVSLLVLLKEHHLYGGLAAASKLLIRMRFGLPFTDLN